MDEIDFPRLWTAVEAQFRGSLDGIHGRHHWRQVERNGLLLSEKNALPPDDVLLVRLFAVMHDSQRLDDGSDKGHGERAAAFARAQNGRLFTLPAGRLKLLEKACAAHERGFTTPDPVIGTCWDADRLDLVRIGASPREELMNTPAGKSLARAGWR